MEEKPDTAVYDDFKFLTHEEMERLNLTQYIGTSAVRVHLHGFIVRYELYKKVKLVSCNVYGVLSSVDSYSLKFRFTC
jgi:hypothetical protein